MNLFYQQPVKKSSHGICRSERTLTLSGSVSVISEPGPNAHLRVGCGLTSCGSKVVHSAVCLARYRNGSIHFRRHSRLRSGSRRPLRLPAGLVRPLGHRDPGFALLRNARLPAPWVSLHSSTCSTVLSYSSFIHSPRFFFALSFRWFKWISRFHWHRLIALYQLSNFITLILLLIAIRLGKRSNAN